MAGKFESKETPTFPKSYKDTKYPDIEKWCLENGQIAWLAETMDKKTEHMIYPKKLDEYGRPLKYKGEDGKMHFVKDLEALPTCKAQPISFTKVKSLFFDEFFPNQKKDPNAKTNLRDKKESMHKRAMRLAKEAREAEQKPAEEKSNG
jgi:hypothetical protein